MLRLGKLTDYAALVLGHLAAHKNAPVSTADIAQATRVPSPTVSKILKILSRTGIVISMRGANGGYKLAFDAQDIALLDIIEAMEGPVALTTCINNSDERCALEDVCSMHGRWRPVNTAIRAVLGEMSLADLLDMGEDQREFARAESLTREERRL
jgi:FeS assembly SUF system regulator